MLRSIVVAVAVGVPFLAPLPMPAPVQQVSATLGQLAPGFCLNIIPREPLVVYDVTGGTLAGFLHEQLTVYSDGSASASSFVSFGGGAGVADAAVAFPGPEAAADLLSALGTAGAFQLCDQDMIVSDLPLSTLTVMRKGTDARAHTYCFWSAEGPWAQPAVLVNAFLDQHFPNLGNPGT